MSELPSSQSEEFTGGPRFELRRRLGEGGFGTVYEAFDREHNCLVALKHLRRVTADTLYAFKQEFRSLTDLSHPNLVSLYELISDPSGHWLLVMELIDGVDFLSYQATGPRMVELEPLSAGSGLDEATAPFAPTLGPEQTTAADESIASVPLRQAAEAAFAPTLGFPMPAQPATLAVTQGPGAMDPQPSESASPPPLVQLQQVRSYAALRDSLRQLAEGLCALHAADKLHRDIKPSNILITKEGRVVLLDFGLVLDAPVPVEAGAGTAQPRQPPPIVGTPIYMAPEQFGIGPIGPAADWYSVGVLLYEVLTAQLPFNGDLYALARAKQEQEPVPPRMLRPDIPADLDSLCAQLLRRDPGQRPTGEQVQRWLAGKDFAPSQGGSRRPRARLVEREPHFAALEAARAAAVQGQTAVVLIEGRSGMGKSTLAQAYLQMLASTPEPPLVISGRCYEQESVPYKALDGVIDALCQHLRTLPDAAVAALLTADAGALSQLFPVLRQVAALRTQPEQPASERAGEEVRDRAFAALRTLITRLAALQPVLIMIDDLQWGGLDSAALMLDLLRPPAPPRLLVLLCLRSDEIETSPTLRFLLPRLQATASDSLQLSRLEVSALSAGAARLLASELLGGQAPLLPQQALTNEAGHSPFFVTELARYLRDAAHAPPDIESADSAATADDLLWRRVERLRAPARRALECLSLLGRPSRRQLISLAAELGNEELSALHELRTSHMVRTRRSETASLLEPYHDRIRETVARRLPESERRARHLSLATVIEQTGFGDAEDLARHLYGSGQIERARLYIRTAARQATAALAFGRAAELLQTALSWGAETDAGELYAELGNANSAIGQGRAAAEAYLRAAELSTPEAATELRTRAADQLLRSGFLDQGLDVLSADLRRLGIRLPADPRISMVMGMLRKSYIDHRGLATKIRPESECSPADLQRLDQLQSVTVGFSMALVARLADLQSRTMQLALQIGEPFRLARALFMDAASGATRGIKAHTRSQRYIERGLEVAAQTSDPRVEIYKYLSPGVVAYLEGRFAAARELLREAELRLRGVSGVPWEFEVTTRYLLISGFMLGELQPLLERSESLLRDVLRRDDAYAESSLRPTVLYMAELLRDDPAAALAHAAAAQARWVNRGFSGQHYWAECARLDVLLYSERWQQADEHIRGPWMRDTRRYLLPFHQYARITTLHRCGRTSLAAASLAPAGSARRRALLAEVERTCTQLLREQAGWATALAWQLRGPQLALAGNRPAALDWMLRARTLCSELGLLLYAISLDYRYGQLLDGQAGAQRSEAALQNLAERGARAPEKLVAMLLPMRL